MSDTRAPLSASADGSVDVVQRRFRRLEDRVQRTIGRIAGVRLVAFLTALICAVAAAYDRELMPYGPVAGLATVVFLIAVFLHRRPYALLPRVQERRRTAQDDWARLNHNWSALDTTGERFLRPDRPQLSELQVFGRHSLFQLVNRAGLPWGQDRVASCLSDGAEQTQVKAYHEAAQELAAKRVLRHRVEVESRLVDVDHDDLEQLLKWAEAESGVSRWLDTAYWLALVLVPTTIFQVVLTLGFGWVTMWQASFLAQLLLFAYSAPRLTPYYIHLIGNPKERPIVALRSVFERVESGRFKSALLTGMQSAWKAGDGRSTPSKRITRFERIIDALAVRHSALLYSVLAICFMWDIFNCRRLERWRRRYGHTLRADLRSLADFEYVCSIAGFAAMHSDYAWPNVQQDPQGVPIAATHLGHPLIRPEQRKSNDFSLPSFGRMMLVTGSNMSGKSTFLRTLGANVRLALGGFPVCARTFDLVRCEISTSIQVVDSPSEGLSRFYAEVKRLAHVLRHVEAADGQKACPHLYLIDEMLSGTNSRERSIASRFIVKRLVAANQAFGLVTTHDLALVSVEKDLPGRVVCTHFADRFDGDKMHFDYQMKPGVAQTTNALRVLRLEGLEIPDEDPMGQDA